jgi:hypothetical protein
MTYTESIFYPPVENNKLAQIKYIKKGEKYERHMKEGEVY